MSEMTGFVWLTRSIESHFHSNTNEHFLKMSFVVSLLLILNSNTGVIVQSVLSDQT